MDTQTLIALSLFAVATLVTPGPNNLMLMTSGANFGMRRSVQHMAGVAYGFPLMAFAVGLGVMQLFDVWPPLRGIMTVLCAGYLLWLAFKIARTKTQGTAKQGAKPLNFWQAAAFQWVNPKAWAMAIGAITLYAPGRDLIAITWVVLAFALIGTLSATAWTGLGTVIRQWLAAPGRLIWFNRSMALLLVLSVLPALIHELG